jgi:hypothetical protein
MAFAGRIGVLLRRWDAPLARSSPSSCRVQGSAIVAPPQPPSATTLGHATVATTSAALGHSQQHLLDAEIGSANAVEPFAATNAITAKIKAPNVLTDMVLPSGELHQRALLAVCAEGLS